MMKWQMMQTSTLVLSATILFGITNHPFGGFN